jgi:hypothetical protein
MEEARYTERELHRKLAVELNQFAWRLLEREERTPDEEDEMLQAAYASCWHWRQVGTPLEQARGQWLISRVCTVLRLPDAALRHARRSLELCEQHRFGDFDLAYAYEGMARACAAAALPKERAEYRQRACEAGEAIREEEDRRLFFSDLEAGPWFHTG